MAGFQHFDIKIYKCVSVLSSFWINVVNFPKISDCLKKIKLTHWIDASGAGVVQWLPKEGSGFQSILSPNPRLHPEQKLDVRSTARTRHLTIWWQCWSFERIVAHKKNLIPFFLKEMSQLKNTMFTDSSWCKRTGFKILRNHGLWVGKRWRQQIEKYSSVKEH